MRWITALLALLAAAGALFIVPIVLDAYRESRFETTPTSDATGDRVTTRVDGDAKQVDASQGQRDLAHDGRSPQASLPPVEPPASIAQRQQLAAAAEQARSELESERARIARLTDELASAERTREMQLSALQQKVASEQARSADLLRDLGQAREQIARTFHDRVVKSDQREAEDGALVGERLRHAVDPGMEDDATLPMAVRLRVGPAMASQRDGAAGRSSPSPVSPRAADDTGQGAALRSAVALGRDDGAALVPPPASAAGVPATAPLPDGVAAWVTVEYPRGSETARERAVALSRTLQAQGFDVGDPVDVQGSTAEGRVRYFYLTDQASAARVAALSTVPPPVRSRLPARGRLPRPGTIEIAVADQAASR